MAHKRVSQKGFPFSFFNNFYFPFSETPKQRCAVLINKCRRRPAMFFSAARSATAQHARHCRLTTPIQRLQEGRLDLQTVRQSERRKILKTSLISICFTGSTTDQVQQKARFRRIVAQTVPRRCARDGGRGRQRAEHWHAGGDGPAAPALEKFTAQKYSRGRLEQVQLIPRVTLCGTVSGQSRLCGDQ